MSGAPARLLARADLSAGAAWIGLAAFLLLAMRQSFTVPYTGLGLPPAQLVLFVLVLLWVLTRVLGQRSPAGLGVLGAVLLVRLLLLVLSYGLASGRALSADQLSSADRAVAVEAVAAGAVLVLVTLLRRLRDIEFVLRLAVLGGAVSGVAAVLFYGTGYDLAASLRLPGLPETIPTQTPGLVREGLVRARGTAAAPLELGAAMTILVPIAIGLFYAARRRGEHGWIWLAAGVAMTGGAVVSLSRSVFLGVGAALLVMALGWPVRRIAAVIGVVAVVVLAAVASGVRLVQALTTLLFEGSDDYSLGSRADGRDYVARHFADHLWLGQGPGTYDLTRQPILDDQYLSQLMETGVLGLLLFAVMLLCATGYAIAAARRLTGDGREVALGVAGALVAILIVSLILDTAGFAQVYTLGWLVIALAAALWRLARTGEPAAAGSLTAVPAAAPVR